MRKIIVLEFITLDGVMQAGGNPDEDMSGDFKWGGWAAPYLDGGAAGDEFMAKQLKPADLLLGRKTFEIFASFWPAHEDMWPGVNDVTKYVMSGTDMKLDSWKNSIRLKDLADIKKLKESEGTDIQVHGSGNLVQTLFKHDLVDELWLKTLPITLGQGKRLFANGTIAAAFTLTDSLVTPNGVIFANYKRAGEVKTGTAGGENEKK
ncbi:MAG TPA: dihydrofolate reductase family protein [Puia sp.]|nr:dihydrofolate reductase family protein [Puia sp.]